MITGQTLMTELDKHPYTSQGMWLLEEGQYEHAVIEFQQGIDAGETIAIARLASMYENGLGVPANPELALEHFTKAADLGVTEAINRLAYFYTVGFHVAQDYEKAFELHTLAADQGSAESLCDLGHFHMRGIHVERDVSKAILYYQLATEKGSSAAHRALSEFFISGPEEFRDINKGIEHLTIAAKDNDEHAQTKLGNLLLGIQFSELEDFEAAFYWLELAASRGSGLAMYHLGHCYEHAIGLVEDIKMAEFWYEKACTTGEMNAAFALGTFFERAKNGVKDNARALNLYQAAAEKGHVQAHYNAGILLFWGIGVQQDLSLAYKYFNYAAMRGHGQAKASMGQALLNGDDYLAKDEKAGVKFLIEASQQGVSDADGLLGFCYMSGRGVEIDISKSIYHSQRAAEDGDAWAQLRLAHALIQRQDSKADLIDALKWLVISFNQAEDEREQRNKPTRRRHELIKSEYEYVRGLLSDEDFEETIRQFQ